MFRPLIVMSLTKLLHTGRAEGVADPLLHLRGLATNVDRCFAAAASVS